MARAASSSPRDFQDWIVSVDSIGAMLKSIKEHMPVAGELHSRVDGRSEILVHPVDVMNHKVPKWGIFGSQSRFPFRKSWARAKPFESMREPSNWNH
eukprot:8485635-Pyramimonas_sp.AAC.1